MNDALNDFMWSRDVTRPSLAIFNEEGEGNVCIGYPTTAVCTGEVSAQEEEKTAKKGCCSDGETL